MSLEKNHDTEIFEIDTFYWKYDLDHYESISLKNILLNKFRKISIFGHFLPFLDLKIGR